MYKYWQLTVASDQAGDARKCGKYTRDILHGRPTMRSFYSENRVTSIVENALGSHCTIIHSVEIRVEMQKKRDIREKAALYLIRN